MDSPAPAYPTVSPYLVVTDASAVIEFTRACFDAGVVDRRTHADGSVAAVALQIGDSVLMLTERDNASEAQRFHVYVADVTASYQRALSNGATALSAPAAGPDGLQQAGVTGPCGLQWWMSPAPNGTEGV